MNTRRFQTGHRYRPKNWHWLADFARKLKKASDSEAGAVVPGVSAEELHELSADLLKIAGGNNALEVFFARFGKPRASRGNKSRSVEAYNAACAYWHARLEDPAADDAPAILAAQRKYLTNPPTPVTIRRIATEKRDRALETLEGWVYWIDEEGKPQKRRRRDIALEAIKQGRPHERYRVDHDHDTTKLRAYLRLKSPHIKD